MNILVENGIQLALALILVVLLVATMGALIVLANELIFGVARNNPPLTLSFLWFRKYRYQITKILKPTIVLCAA